MYDVARVLDDAEAVLDELPEGPLPEADAHALELVIQKGTRIERKMAEFRLRASRAADESRACVASGATDTGAWLAKLTGSSAAVMRGGLWLARMLQERYPSVREAFASGGLGEEHARIIVRAAEQMPKVITEEDRQEAVFALVEATVQRRLNLKALRRQGRRMLDRINRQYADQHEAALIAQEERVARNETYMSLGDNGDGTWTGRFVIPDLQAGMLLTVLEHMSSPRRMHRNAAGEVVVDLTIADRTEAHMGLNYYERLGQAFLELCEHLPTDGLAQHGRVGATIAVHIDHQHLVDGLAAAHLDTGSDISVGEARRLSCNAGIMPIVYGGQSVPLDTGREKRLHNKAQRIALSDRYDTCAAEGCQRPFAWCEIHHPIHWAKGGRTDLTGIPLCGWHHRRAHDDRYDMRHLPTGEVRYKRRR
jgi:hypothetical protein